MDQARALVVYYSRTGATSDLARAIHGELGGEIEPILDRTRRSGPLGYLRSAFDATFHRPTMLRPMRTDPNDYDLVLVGTPIWNASISAPVRTYLQANRDRIRRVAFFCTYGGTGSRLALREMEAVCGQRPVATLVVRADDVHSSHAAQKVRAFASVWKPRSPSRPSGTSLRPPLVEVVT